MQTGDRPDDSGVGLPCCAVDRDALTGAWPKWPLRQGLLTMMFTDVVDSTRLKAAVGGDSA